MWGLTFVTGRDSSVAQLRRAEIVQSGKLAVGSCAVQARLALLAFGHLCEDSCASVVCGKAMQAWLTTPEDFLPLSELYRNYEQRHVGEMIDLADAATVEALLNRIKGGE